MQSLFSLFHLFVSTIFQKSQFFIVQVRERERVVSQRLSRAVNAWLFASRSLKKRMKVQFILRFLVVVALASSVVISGVIENTHRKRRKHLSSDGGDYEASGDYFEIEGQVRTTEKLSTLIAATMSTLLVDAGSGEGSGSEFETSTQSSSPLSSTEGSDIDDDGSTCISTNITRFDDVYELRNHVLAIFKVNVSSNGRELY